MRTPPRALPTSSTTNAPSWTVSRAALGGVRTPAVGASTAVLRGDTEQDAPVICQLFGSTLPLEDEVLRYLYGDRATYLSAYEQATDEAIAAGFVLAEDRDAVLAEARPDLIPEATT